MKALTFGYDDGVLQDERLIGIFNKYQQTEYRCNLNRESYWKKN